MQTLVIVLLFGTGKVFICFFIRCVGWTIRIWFRSCAVVGDIESQTVAELGLQSGRKLGLL